MIDPQLRRALSGHLPAQEVADAIAESFAYAWEHWARVQMMENPAGYLYRVAQSKARARKQGFLPWPSDSSMPDYEPGLAPALDELSPSQQRAVWLVHGCGWTYAEDRGRARHVDVDGRHAREPRHGAPAGTPGGARAWMSSSASCATSPRTARRRSPSSTPRH